MRALLRRLFTRSPRPRHQPRHAPTSDRGPAPAAYPSLRAWQVRHRDFTVCRRGLDPTEVTSFLARVADELAVAHTALAALAEENQLIKHHLRAWQTHQSRHHYYDLAGR